MQTVDILFVLRWWVMFFLIGVVFLPLTSLIFNKFVDKGYILSKIIGIAFVSYIVFVLGILKMPPFALLTIDAIIIGFLIFNIFLIFKYPNILVSLKKSWRIFLFEELLFISTLFLWSFIRAHQPDIHGLEKYMDFGFINSILRSTYFPPPDMWLTPYSINYYYFGHLVTAVLTKLSGISSSVTFNLMLATLFAFTFTASFSIGANLIYLLISKFEARNSKQFSKERFWSRRYAPPQNDVILASKRSLRVQNPFRIFIGGLLTAFIVSLAGNLHTIYAFFKPYVNENPVPFWQLAFSPNSFPNSYWYPNATRFIHNTIHEFPLYSSVVSDLHGHFLDVPFVLLTIAVLLSLISKFEAQNPKPIQNSKTQKRDSGVVATLLPRMTSFWLVQNPFRISNFEFRILLLGFILAIMYMTNAWDGLIYLLLSILIIGYVKLRSMRCGSQHQSIKYYVSSIMSRAYFIPTTLYLILIFIGFFVFSLPFNLFFKPFASGIGILCAPEFLTNMEKFGPFLFEKDHCQRSPIWQVAILYGFFYFGAISFVVFLFKKKNSDSGQARMTSFWGAERLQNLFRNLHTPDIFVLLLIAFSTLLIIIPEFIYVKDIYPGHYRANTMFKLVYQSFIMLSIASGYIIVRIISNVPPAKGWHWRAGKFAYWKLAYWIIGIIGLSLVMIYPYFAINSYYGDLKTYYSLDGILYLKKLYPTDYSAILWINKNIKAQPVILEAQGDSYTDYARISTNTGLPTVLGWAVHEWLWRGSYDIPSPRINDVKTLYETQDLNFAKELLKKYNVSLVFVGDLEKQKYPTLDEEKFKKLGKVLFQSGETRVYKID